MTITDVLRPRMPYNHTIHSSIPTYHMYNYVILSTNQLNWVSHNRVGAYFLFSKLSGKCVTFAMLPGDWSFVLVLTASWSTLPAWDPI